MRDQTEAIVDAVKELSAEGSGDILVFLPGEREIRDTADALSGHGAARGGAALLAALRRRAAQGLRATLRAPGGAGHQRRRDLADRPRHPVRRGHRRRADLALLRAHQGAAAADRGDQPGLGQPALRSLRPGRRRHRDPALLRGGLRGPPGVHRARDPAHQPGLGDPADDLAGSRRPGPVPVRRAAGPAQRHRRSSAARGAQRHLVRRAAHQDRQAPRPAADRPAAGPDDPGGRAARVPPRGPRHRRRALAPGPPGAARGDAPAGRPAARALQGRELRLPHLAQPLALRQEAAARAEQQRVPPDVQARVPQLPAGARVAGLRVAAAPGLQGDASRSTVARPSDRYSTTEARTGAPYDADGIHQALLSGLLSHIGLLEERDASTGRQPGDAARGSTSAPAARGSRSSRAAGCTGRTRSS